MDDVTRKKKTEAKLKKAFRPKLLELCKTRTKKSNPDLFNFYVVLTGHDIITDADRATTCRRKLKAPTIRKKNHRRFRFRENTNSMLPIGKLPRENRGSRV